MFVRVIKDGWDETRLMIHVIRNRGQRMRLALRNGGRLPLHRLGDPHLSQYPDLLGTPVQFLCREP